MRLIFLPSSHKLSIVILSDITVTCRSNLTLLADGIKITGLFFFSVLFLGTLNSVSDTRQLKISYSKCSASRKGTA